MSFNVLQAQFSIMVLRFGRKISADSYNTTTGEEKPSEISSLSLVSDKRARAVNTGFSC